MTTTSPRCHLVRILRDLSDPHPAVRQPPGNAEVVIGTQVVILAAGMGTRLGRPLPKPLTRLANGETILGKQIKAIRTVLGPRAEVMVVVGFKLEQIMEAVPDVSFAYNEDYDRTNTAKSLLRALRVTGDRGVMWLNGDVVFDPEVLDRIRPLMAGESSFVCVNTTSVGEEEVKYTIGADGSIARLSKLIDGGLGEAVGINFVSAADKNTLVTRLEEVDELDYFERGMELCIELDGVRFLPVDITDLFAVEVDFESDLEAANQHL